MSNSGASTRSWASKSSAARSVMSRSNASEIVNELENFLASSPPANQAALAQLPKSPKVYKRPPRRVKGPPAELPVGPSKLFNKYLQLNRKIAELANETDRLMNRLRKNGYKVKPGTNKKSLRRVYRQIYGMNNPDYAELLRFLEPNARIFNLRPKPVPGPAPQKPMRRFPPVKKRVLSPVKVRPPPPKWSPKLPKRMPKALPERVPGPLPVYKPSPVKSAVPVYAPTRLLNHAAGMRILAIKEYLAQHNLSQNMVTYLAGKERDEIAKFLKRRNVNEVHAEPIAQLAAPTVNEKYYKLVGSRRNLRPREIFEKVSENPARVQQLIEHTVQEVAAWKIAKNALSGVVNIVPSKPTAKQPAPPKPVVVPVPVRLTSPVKNEGHGVFEGKPVKKGPKGGFFIVTNRGQKKYLPKK